MQDLSDRIIDFLVPLTVEELSILINIRGNITAFALSSPHHERTNELDIWGINIMKL